MSDSFQSMTDTLMLFRDATESKDWDQVAQLDERFRADLEVAMAGRSGEDMNKELASFLKRAYSVYELVKAGAQKNRDEISAELSQLSKEKKAVASYQQSSRWR